MTRRLPLSRRAVLRGLGASVALPWLEATAGRAWAAEAVPRRFVGFFLPNGIVVPDWVPSRTGPLDTLPPALAPLQPVTGAVRVLTGLSNVPQASGTHQDRTRTAWSEFFGDDPAFDPANEVSGRSLDQAIADVVGGGTALRSLVVGSEPAAGCPPPDCGESLFTTSWRGTDQPVLPDRSVRSVFERLFGAPDAGGLPAAQRVALHRSVLDAVKGDADALRERLGSEDRLRLDAWLEGVRAVERRVDAPPPDPTCGGEAPVDSDAFDVHVRTMSELAVRALACDRTRVVSILPGNDRSHVRFPWIGEEDHHLISHQQPDQHTQIVAWYVARFVELVQALQAESQLDGTTLLDHTWALFYSGMGDGNDHAATDLPILLAGSGGSAAPPPLGHLAWPGTPVAGLHLSLLRAFDPGAAAWGNQAGQPLLDLG